MKTAILISLISWLSVAVPVGGIEVQAPSKTGPAAQVAPGQNRVTQLNRPAPALMNGRSPSIVVEIEKLVDGGAAPDVIKAYVRNWSARFWLGADDLLRLNEHGTPDDVLITLIERSAELRAQSMAAAMAAPSPNLVTTNLVTTGGPAVSYPQLAQPAPQVYAYPASYPAYTYSYLYPTWSWPSYSYRYWWPSTYSFVYYSWPSYRHHGFHHRPHYWHGQHKPVFAGHRSWPSHGFHRHSHFGHRPVHGHGIPRYSYVGHGRGGAWSPAAHGFRGSHGSRPGRR